MTNNSCRKRGLIVTFHKNDNLDLIFRFFQITVSKTVAFYEYTYRERSVCFKSVNYGYILSKMMILGLKNTIVYGIINVRN